MKLQDCVSTADIVVTAPLVRSEAEEDWLQAKASGSIPESVFDLYCKSNYLSFGSAPSFLRDTDNTLFGYFGMLLRGLMESFSDADVQLARFLEAQNLVRDYGKIARKEPWEKDALFRARRHFRDLLIALQAGLDNFADLVALFLTGSIQGLRFGRAQFSQVETWLEKPLPPEGLIVTPYDEPKKKLYDALRPLVHADAPERDWLPLMRMLRNKIAHLSPATIRSIGLHDETFHFYEFIPRQWPYLWEKHMKPHGHERPSDPLFVQKLFQETLIHQDIESYCRGLRAKVLKVIDAGVSVLLEMYIRFADFGLNQAAMAELQSNSLAYDFEYFKE
jgi:hypothetical protein